ncbi:MAG TPA: hypothetical protein VJ279_02755, partial [Hanamia sp.]|nr:hypothetical protein [Hanamia sp.]
KIASYAKITEIRAKRAIHDITEAGYLTTIRQYKITDDGRKIGQTAIRTISRSLFRDLNIDHLSIFKASEWKRKRNEKKLAKKNKARLRELLGSVGKLADKTTSSSFSAIRKATVLLEHVAKEIMPIIHKIEKAK